MDMYSARDTGWFWLLLPARVLYIAAVQQVACLCTGVFSVVSLRGCMFMFCDMFRSVNIVYDSVVYVSFFRFQSPLVHRKLPYATSNKLCIS